MKVYIASRFRVRPQLLELQAKITEAGHECVSRWLNESPPKLIARDSPDYPASAIECSTQDLEDVKRADVLVLYSYNCELTPGGLWVEFGYAMGLNKWVIVVGPKINVFCYHPEVLHVEDTEELLKHLRAIGTYRCLGTPGVWRTLDDLRGTPDRNGPAA